MYQYEVGKLLFKHSKILFLPYISPLSLINNPRLKNKGTKSKTVYLPKFSTNPCPKRSVKFQKVKIWNLIHTKLKILSF